MRIVKSIVSYVSVYSVAALVFELGLGNSNEIVGYCTSQDNFFIRPDISPHRQYAVLIEGLQGWWVEILTLNAVRVSVLAFLVLICIFDG